MTEESKQIIETMKEMFSALSSEIQDMKKDIRKLEVTVENTSNKNIQLLAEGFSAMAQSNSELKSVPADIQEIKSDLAVVKDVVTGHSEQINKLSKVK